MKMLDHALDYAAKGYHVFPVHEPLFRDGKLVGCTCESYKRSAKYKAYLEEQGRGNQFDPQYQCANPGKCPRVKWGEKSTTDADQIRQWWHWWPTSNIGIDCGKSGILVFDLDTYKEVYGDDGIIAMADRETVTSLTGGGGEHLWFALGDKPYGNSTKGLPVGIDIRGLGGYIVAPPSLHKSGRRYTFEDNYSLHELAPLALPPALAQILDASHRTIRTHTSQVTPDSSSVARSAHLAERVFGLLDIAPIATGWGQGLKYILDACPFNPAEDPHVEDRSAFVCIAADGAISAGCHHNRCQHIIEDSGLSGWHLLKQIAGVAPTDGKPDDAFHGLLAMARSFAKTVSFGEFIPTELQSKAGYRTDGTDTRVYDALLDLVALAHNFTVFCSLETGRDLAGVGSKATFKAAIERLLAAGLIERNHTAKAADLAQTYRINIEFVLRRLNAENSNKALCVQSTQYENGKATDPFLSGKSRTAKREGLTEAGLGESALRILDVLNDGQGWERLELSEETGKKAGGLGRTLKRLEELEIVYSERETPRSPKIYYLSPDAWDRIAALTPKLKTYHLRAERKERALEAEQSRVDIRLDMATQPRAVENYAMRRSEIIAARRRYLAVIHPEWTNEDILKWILAPKANARPWVERQEKRLDAEARQWAKQNISGSQAQEYAFMAGYTKHEAAVLADKTTKYMEGKGEQEIRFPGTGIEGAAHSDRRPAA